MDGLERFGAVRTVGGFNEVKPEPDGPGVFPTLGASLRQSTSLGSLFSGERATRIDDFDALEDDVFTREDIENLSSVYEPYADRFAGLTRDGAAAMRRNIDAELRDRETIERAGFLGGTAADVAVQFLDPVNYIPVGGAVFKGATLGRKLARGAAAGFVGAAIQEPILYGSQSTRTVRESLSNVGASVAFGLMIGQGAHLVDLGRARWGNPVANVRGDVRPDPVDFAPLRAAVRQNVLDQRMGQGIAEVDATHEAELWGSAYEALASRPGVDARALAEAMRVKIETEAVTPVGVPDADGVSYNQAGRMLTETPEFKAWFGDSQMVDADGAPLVVYHGTGNANAIGGNADFELFNPLSHFGTIAAANERLTESGFTKSVGNRIMPVYLSISNPVRIEDDGVAHTAERIAIELKNKDILTSAQVDAVIGNYEESGRAKALVAALSEKGYDGFQYTNVYEDAGSESYVAFSPTQIKSVYNRGTFSPDDPRILFQGGVSDPHRGDDLRDLLTEVRAARAYRKALVGELAATDGPVRLSGNGGKKAVITRGLESEYPDGWRVTRVDADGPSGHTDYPTKEAALDEALRDGYGDPKARALMRPTTFSPDDPRILFQSMPGKSLVTDDVVAFAQSDDVMPDVGLKVGKSARFWRGVNKGSGGNSAEYGEGLYVAGSRSEAQSYVDDGGRLIEMDRSDLPQNPIRFRDNLDWQRWRDRVMGEMGLRGAREYGPKFPDISQLIQRLYPDVDGVQISTGKDAIFVNYGGDRVFEQQARGSIEFPQSGVTQGQTVIKLMAGADQSTFLHESGHMFLQVMSDLDATMGEKSPFKADLAEVRKWAGVKDGDDFGRAAHEKFARGFEQYLRTGKAPSDGLRRAFDAFKEWLIKVYASAADLNVDVSPEMARVYDRILVPDISEMPGGYPVAKDAGAAAVGSSSILDPESGEYRMATATDYALRNAAARVVEKVTIPITPNDQVARSPLVGIKRLMGNLVEDMRDTEASRQGDITTAVETEVKNDRDMVESNLYAIMGKDGKRFNHPKIERDELNRRILDAVANPDGELDPDIRRVADALFNDIIAPFEEQLRAAGMLGESQKWTKDGRYAPHSWSPEKILENVRQFRAKMGARINDALDAGYKLQIDSAVKTQQNYLREIEQIEIGADRRREDFRRRTDGQEVDFTEEDLRSFVMQSRNKPDQKRPPSLRDFIVNQGGIWSGDDRGEVAAMGFNRPGFLKKDRRVKSAAGDNGGGLMMDEMREAAEEAGYLRAGSSVNELIDALDADVRGRRVYSQADSNEVEAWSAYDEFINALEEMGIDPSGKRTLRVTSATQKEMIGKTIDAMERIEAVRVADIKAKIREIESENLNARDTLDDPQQMRAEVETILDEVQAKLTKAEEIWSEDMSLEINTAGPLKRRSIDVRRSEFSEFMENDVIFTIGGHMHRMIPEYHLTTRYGRPDLKHDIASIRAEADRYADTLDGEERVKFMDKLAKDITMITTTRDQLRGTYAQGQSGKIAEAARFMSTASYVMQLGDVTTSSLGDAIRPVMVHGAAHLLRHGFPRVADGVGQFFKALDPDDYLRSDRAGIVMERITSSRVMATMELDADYLTNSKAQRVANNMAGWATRISLMDRWNQMGKHITAGLFMDRLGEMSGRSWDDLKPEDQGYLSLLRISKNQWPYIADAIQTKGKKDRGIWSFNFKDWDDPALVRLARGAMRKEVDSVIVTPGLGDKVQQIGGVNMAGPVGKMVLQYKSFWISGHQRILLRASQNPDVMATASGALAMVVIGMMIDDVKAYTGGYELSDNIGTRVMGGLDRSGVIPLWMEANNMLERATAVPLAYRAAGGLGLLGGAENGGNTSTRYAGRNVLGSLLGPSAGVVSDGVRVFGDVSREVQGLGDGITPGTVGAAKRLLPFQNAPIVRPMLNWWAVPALKDLAG